MTLEAKNQYLLRGGVFIGDDVNETILTIEAGTTIYGESSTDGLLVIRRNSKIYAEGRSDAQSYLLLPKKPVLEVVVTGVV